MSLPVLLDQAAARGMIWWIIGIIVCVGVWLTTPIWLGLIVTLAVLTVAAVQLDRRRARRPDAWRSSEPDDHSPWPHI